MTRGRTQAAATPGWIQCRAEASRLSAQACVGHDHVHDALVGPVPRLHVQPGSWPMSATRPAMARRIAMAHTHSTDRWNRSWRCLQQQSAAKASPIAAIRVGFWSLREDRLTWS